MSDADENKTKVTPILKHEFFFETPLYDVIDAERFEDDFFDGDVDAYSALNGIDTTYSIDSESMNRGYAVGFSGFNQIKLTCKRKQNDTLRFFVYEGNGIVVKVGQLPSLADLQFAELGKKYDKLLSRDDLQEFKKAIGLAAHGVGAGSFVYLRRIFEKLIDQTYQEHEKSIPVAKTEYLLKRMNEKVELLKGHLPSQLVAMKKIYKILSAGVHKLSEQECLTYFPALKLSIELILEQQIEKETKAKRDEQARKQIEAIQEKLT